MVNMFKIQSARSLYKSDVRICIKAIVRCGVYKELMQVERNFGKEEEIK